MEAANYIMRRFINKCGLSNQSVEGANMCMHYNNSVRYPTSTLIIVKSNSWKFTKRRALPSAKNDKKAVLIGLPGELAYCVTTTQ
jgi:hypothetical protein